MPDEIGSWNSVYNRFARRSNERGQQKGIWQMLKDRLAADRDIEWLTLDSTVARSHSGAVGAKKSEGDQCLGAHGAAGPASCTAACGVRGAPQPRMADSLGNPLRIALTAIQAGDAPEATPLLGTVSMMAVQVVLAYRAHDSDATLAWTTAAVC